MSIPVYLKRRHPDLPGFEIGDCIGIVELPEGVTLKAFVTAIRNRLAGP